MVLQGEQSFFLVGVNKLSFICYSIIVRASREAGWKSTSYRVKENSTRHTLDKIRVLNLQDDSVTKMPSA